MEENIYRNNDLFKLKELKNKNFTHDELTQLDFNLEQLKKLLEEKVFEFSFINDNDEKNRIKPIKLYKLSNLGVACIDEITQLYERTNFLNNRKISFTEFIDDLKKEETKLNVDWFFYSLSLHNLIRIENNILKVDLEKLKTLIKE